VQGDFSLGDRLGIAVKTVCNGSYGAIQNTDTMGLVRLLGLETK
jgi:hypothetical protein